MRKKIAQFISLVKRKILTANNRNPFIPVRSGKHIGMSDMAFMSFETKFLSRFLDMKSEDILRVLDKPHSWVEEYKIYKKFQKLVDGETDSYTLHVMAIWNFEDLEKAMNAPDFEEKYSQELARWS